METNIKMCPSVDLSSLPDISCESIQQPIIDGIRRLVDKVLTDAIDAHLGYKSTAEDWKKFTLINFLPLDLECQRMDLCHNGKHIGTIKVTGAKVSFTFCEGIEIKNI